MLGDRQFLVLDIPYGDVNFSRNVVCVDASGQELWRCGYAALTEHQFGCGRVRKNGILEFSFAGDGWVAVDPETGNSVAIRLDRLGDSPEHESDDKHWTPLNPVVPPL